MGTCGSRWVVGLGAGTVSLSCIRRRIGGRAARRRWDGSLDMIESFAVFDDHTQGKENEVIIVEKATSTCLACGISQDTIPLCYNLPDADFEKFYRQLLC